MYFRRPDDYVPAPRPWMLWAAGIAMVMGYAYYETTTRLSVRQLRDTGVAACVDAGVSESDCYDRYEENGLACYRANYLHGSRTSRGGLNTAGFIECLQYPSVDAWWHRKP
jgi:hypothetical protein